MEINKSEETDESKILCLISDMWLAVQCSIVLHLTMTLISWEKNWTSLIWKGMNPAENIYQHHPLPTFYLSSISRILQQREVRYKKDYMEASVPPLWEVHYVYTFCFQPVEVNVTENFLQLDLQIKYFMGEEAALDIHKVMSNG